MARLAAVVSFCALGGTGAVAAVAVEDPLPPPVTVATTTVTLTIERKTGGHTAMYWRRQDHRARAHIRRLLQVVRTDGSVSEAINLACAVYGYCSTLWRKAVCETGGTLSPGAYNRGSAASGLFQFLPSTWRTTPYSGFSVWSPYANAMAAGWMHRHGRGGEWSCR